MAKQRQYESGTVSLLRAEIHFKNSENYGILINQFFVMDPMLPLEFVHILACPTCKGELTQSMDGSSLCCSPCARVFPVIDDIPVLFPQQTDSTLRPHCEAA
jgi:uncharacterized protein YbaR (Trm112 family)